MKKYKVEGLIYYSKLSLDRNHLIKQSTDDIQEILYEYSLDGWTLVSTDKTTFGTAMYVHLYFEK